MVLFTEDIAYLADLGHRRALEEGEPLCHEGARGDEVFLVESGSVRVVATAITGRETLLEIRRSGQLVGELSAFDGDPRSASIYANEPTRVVAISTQRFLGAIAARPALGTHLLGAMSRMIRTADQRAVNRDSIDVRTRLVLLLISLSATVVDEHEPDAPVTLRVRQDELASRVGAARETVARVLGDLRSEGYVVTGRGRIELVNLPGLRRLASPLL